MENSATEAPIESEIDVSFMKEALAEACRAESVDEVPIGAVIVRGGEVIARGHNRKEGSGDPTAHAEIEAIREATAREGGWRLEGTTLYVTLEPCVMCMGAMIQARIPRLVFATMDPKAGACGSLFDLSSDKRLNHSIEVTSGIMATEAGELLTNFFVKLRN